GYRAQAFLQLFSSDRELHPLRRLAQCGDCERRIYYQYLIELLVVVVEGGEMLVIRANVHVAHRPVHPPRCGRDVRSVGNPAHFPTTPRRVHTGPHIPSHMLATMRTTLDAPFRRAP